MLHIGHYSDCETFKIQTGGLIGGYLLFVDLTTGMVSPRSGLTILSATNHADEIADRFGRMVAAQKPSQRRVTRHIYTNPGHHVPRTPTYVSGKSVLPANHVRLFEDSVLVGKGKNVRRWAREGCGQNAVYHRFEPHFNEEGLAEFHWSGSTAAVLPNGRANLIRMSDVPVRKIDKILGS